MPVKVCFLVMEPEEFKAEMEGRNIAAMCATLDISRITLTHLAKGRSRQVGLEIKDRVTRFLMDNPK